MKDLGEIMKAVDKLREETGKLPCDLRGATYDDQGFLVKIKPQLSGKHATVTILDEAPESEPCQPREPTASCKTRDLGAGYNFVDHPNHYNNGKFEVIDILEDNLSMAEFVGFLKGNILKYIMRLGKKQDDITDAKKALFYLCSLVRVYDHL